MYILCFLNYALSDTHDDSFSYNLATTTFPCFAMTVTAKQIESHVLTRNSYIPEDALAGEELTPWEIPNGGSAIEYIEE